LLLAGVAAQSPQGLHVVGNEIRNGNNQVMRFKGVDRSGTEFACIQGWGFFDGPHDLTSIAALQRWKVNIVRIPLNEDCWLGINLPREQWGGANYIGNITQIVNLYTSNNIAVILDLHWTAAGSTPATGQQPMPNADHSPRFWSQVAQHFASNTAVIFDLFNEPFQISWSCWQNAVGCNTGYAVAGMQQLVDAVRGAGAKNIVILGGLQWSNDLSQFLQHKINDPTGQMGASWHSYSFNACRDTNCWNSQIAPIAAQMPVITGEFGNDQCDSSYVPGLMDWMDSKGIHMVAWTWNTWDCKGGPAIISSYTGTPTALGAAIQAHYLK
jgi:hypothetical protein